MSDNTKIKFHVIAIFCIIIFCFSLTPVTFQNDTYYSIAIGKHIIENKTIDEVIEMLKGIPCGVRATSCPDQVAQALEEYKKTV